VERTTAFFAELGVELKREETGKLFPVTDSARTVLDALLRAAADAGARVRTPDRVEAIERSGDGFAGLQTGPALHRHSRGVMLLKLSVQSPTPGMSV
jgi:predicted flavoprotein YhiN